MNNILNYFVAQYVHLRHQTQLIKKNALISKKLEEIREKFRKRQEQDQKEQMQKQECVRKHHQGLGQDISPPQSPDEMPKCGQLNSIRLVA